MKLKTFTSTLALLLLLLLVSASAHSQITIGMDESPLDGALLQLKTEEVNDGSANSKKGLLLPRVNLDVTASANSSDVIDKRFYLSLGLSLTTAGDAVKHTGLMIYNLTPATGSANTSANNLFAEDNICPGVYTWTGEKWTRVMSTECQ